MEQPKFVQQPVKEFGWEAGYKYRFSFVPSREYRASLRNALPDILFEAKCDVVRFMLENDWATVPHKLFQGIRHVYFRVEDPAVAVAFKLRFC